MRRRRGFTLVELLVAMALILFIMAVLSQAFVSATGTFRNLKAVGDMAQKLRATTQLLQRDLAADHFEGKKRLSNPNFWQNGPPQQGYFQVWQGSPALSVLEGLDLDGIGSYRSVNHALAFTIKVRGNQMGDFLTAGGAGGAVLGNLGAPNSPFGPNEIRYLLPVGATTYSYQWAEVAWFLQPSINPATGAQDTTAVDQLTNSPGVPLYTLYRRQRLAVPDNSLIPAQPYNPGYASFLEVSCWNNGGTLYFNTPIDLTVPQRRFGGGLTPTPLFPANAPFTTNTQDLATFGQINPGMAGADIQLTDVVSFDVRLLPMLPVGSTPPVDPFVTLFQAPFTGYWNGNPSYPLTGPMVFDTWSGVNDGLSNYSLWNTPAAANTVSPVTSIPLWSTTSITYNVPYPYGYSSTPNPITLTGSGPIILAIQISIRIWDTKTNQTRQVTMVQAM